MTGKDDNVEIPVDLQQRRLAMPPQPVTPGIREVLLQEIQAQQPKSQIDAPLSQNSVLNAATRRLGRGNDEAMLTQWGELFRTGLLAWGLNLSNPNPPFFHLTDTGRRALAHLTRDPSNPDGYLRHLASMTTVNDVAMSYLREGLDCYVAGLYKAAAVNGGWRSRERHSRSSGPNRRKTQSARQSPFEVDRGLAYQNRD
jgi:hypothetical protein